MESRVVRFTLSSVGKETDKSFVSDVEEERFNKMLKGGWVPVSMTSVFKENALLIVFNREKAVSATTKRK